MTHEERLRARTIQWLCDMLVADNDDCLLGRKFVEPTSDIVVICKILTGRCTLTFRCENQPALLIFSPIGHSRCRSPTSPQTLYGRLFVGSLPAFLITSNSDINHGGIAGSNNAYLVKRNTFGGVQFSRDPYNLTNKHSRKVWQFCHVQGRT